MLYPTFWIPAPGELVPSLGGGTLKQLLALSVAGATAAIAYFFAVRQRRLDEKRTTCANAVAHALAWLELPYRIRRRVDDGPATLRAIAEHMHGLQERLLFDQYWLRIEMPRGERCYASLVEAVKRNTEEPLRLAWLADPVQEPSGMNIGPLDIPSVEREVQQFSDEARTQLSWWKLWSN